jgi:hypothetical protein
MLSLAGSSRYAKLKEENERLSGCPRYEDSDKGYTT